MTTKLPEAALSFLYRAVWEKQDITTVLFAINHNRAEVEAIYLCHPCPLSEPAWLVYLMINTWPSEINRLIIYSHRLELPAYIAYFQKITESAQWANHFRVVPLLFYSPCHL